jgi:hypothetical protein
MARPGDVLADHDPAIVALANRARELISETLPEETAEVAYPGWHAIGYRHPEAGYVCGVFPHPDGVKIGFEQGFRLADPEGALSGDGVQVRYLEVARGEEIPAE